MNQATPQSELLESKDATGIGYINIEGDINIHIGGGAKSQALFSPESMVCTLLFNDALKNAIKGQPKPSPATAAAPTIIIRDDAAPWKIMADGQRVDARDQVTDHVALLFPDTAWMIAVNALSRDGKPFSTQQDTETAGKALKLLDYDDWSLAADKVYERHVIDRRFHEPAADKNLYPNLPLSDWYWTSTVTPWSRESAFYVYLRYGYVYYLPRNYSGFGLACRRARQ